MESLEQEKLQIEDRNTAQWPIGNDKGAVGVKEEKSCRREVKKSGTAEGQLCKMIYHIGYMFIWLTFVAQKGCYCLHHIEIH